MVPSEVFWCASERSIAHWRARILHKSPGARQAMCVYPVSPEEREAGEQPSPLELLRSGGPGHEAHQEKQREQHDERPEAIAPDRIARPRAAQVDPGAEGIGCELKCEGKGHGPPRAKAEIESAAGPKRQVGTMHQQVEDPMAYDEQGEHRGSATVVSLPKIDRTNNGATQQRGEQAVRPGKVVEVERRGCHEARLHADVLHAEDE